MLVAAAAGHDTLAELMYAWDLPVGAGPVADRHLGAELMYYGGTVIDVTARRSAPNARDRMHRDQRPTQR